MLVLIFSNNSLKYFSVYIASAFKFIGGIIVGTAEELNFVETAIFTFLGSMTAVIIVVLFGNTYRLQIAHFFTRVKTYYYLSVIKVILKWNLFSEGKRADKIKKIKNRITPKRFSKTIRLIVKAWQRFGILGIAVLTPLLLSPIGGAIIAVSFRVKTRRIIINMLISHLIWAFLFSFLFMEFKEFLENVIGVEFHKSK